MQKPVQRKFSRGAIAVECAIVLPIFILLLSALLYFGRMCWHYTVAEKAAHDAAMFLARVSIKEIRAPSTGLEVPVAAVARAMARAELAELAPGASPPFVNVLCDGLGCDGFTTPTTITVVVRVNMTDPFFSTFLSDFGLGADTLLVASAGTDYAGG